MVARGSKILEEKHRNGKELVEDLNKGIEEKEVIVVHQLPSRDILVTTASQEAHDKLQANTDWL